MFTDLAQNPAGITHCYYICRDVFGHYTSRSNDCIISDRNTRKNYSACSDPAPLSICIGILYWYIFSLSSGRIGCPAVATVTFGPNIV